MEDEIKESRFGLINRVLFKSFIVWSVLCGIALVVFSVLIKELSAFFLGVVILIVGLYLSLSWRAVRIISIGNGLIMLKDGKRTITLEKDAISYVMKLVRFPFGERFGFVIATKDQGFPGPKLYFAINEPRYDFISRFKDMGLRLKNFP